jgi:hypothetical protein
MAGRSSGKYLASHPSLYSRRRRFPGNQPNIENRNVTDTGSSLQPQKFQQPLPSPYGPAHKTNPAAVSMTPVAQHAQKLDELGVLLARHVSPEEAHMKFSWAKFQLEQGDDTYLNDMSELLSTYDSIYDPSSSWNQGQSGFLGNQPNLASRTVADSSFRQQNAKQSSPIPYGPAYSMTPASFRQQNAKQSSPIPYGPAYSMTPVAQHAQKLDELGVLLARHVSPEKAYCIFEWTKQLEQGKDIFLDYALNNFRMWDSIQGSRRI